MGVRANLSNPNRATLFWFLPKPCIFNRLRTVFLSTNQFLVLAGSGSGRSLAIGYGSSPYPENPVSEPTREASGERRFKVVTYGCQMNVHDTEKLSNLLYHAGLREASDVEDADLLVVNTCSIRDKAENQLYSDLGKLRDWKDARPGRVLGVGGCVAQQVGDRLLTRFSQLDFVFGTHNLRLVPAMAAAALTGERASRTEELRTVERFDLPERHASYAGDGSGRAFVTVMEGCDMFCSFCIVPTTRGREISRPADAIIAEVVDLSERGVREITLLGQTVNAYGRHDRRRGRGDEQGTVAFAELLRRIDAVSGIDRLRYTSPHPLFFDDALVASHAELESLCPHVHLPLQSGSTAVLERMRRRYSREGFLEIPERLRESRPDIAITSDIIVAFPGETREDFEQTLSAVRQTGLVDSYSFKYSPRPGTTALELPGSVDPDEAQERLETLQRLQRELTLVYHRSRVGTATEILVEGPSRKSRQMGGQVRGRDPYHRVVNVEGDTAAGELLEVDVVDATPHSLIGKTVKSTGRTAEEGKRNAVPVALEDPLRVL
jgi:tRNA-2-methylthio-N6-dimethylallyladenosine synthase